MRWESLSPYLDYYKTVAVRDVRGYWNLSRDADLAAKLGSWKTLATDEAARLSTWLLGLCRNSGEEEAGCARELEEDKLAGNVKPYYARYVAFGRVLYERFFELGSPRGDLTWSAVESAPVVPFTKPAREDLAALVKKAIEAAWRGPGWQLQLSYTDRADESTTHLLFQPGALPHVNAVGGSEITMDENVPVENELTTSVLQHEFGHVIGFPDCYVEFFEESTAKMINYQIDVGNIMCSRAGRVTELHRDALRKAYGHEERAPAGKRKKARASSPATR
jgi:hypothetical protein